MLRKSFENIDQRAKVPTGFEFKKERIWEKVSKRPKKDSRRFWYWSAAALIPLILLSFWFFKPTVATEPNYLTTTISSGSFEMIVELQTSTIDQKPEKAIVSIPDQPVPFDENEVLETISPDSLESIYNDEPSKILRKTIVFEDIITEPEEKKLSPSALAIQNALEKTKVEQKVEERMIVEKLTFEQMIQARKQYMQEKGNPTKNKRKDD